MPKYARFPYLFNDGKTISTMKLKEWGYLKMHSIINGTVTWSRHGVETSSISILVKLDDYENYLKVDYKCNGTDYNYKVKLVSINSNIGNGLIWYFICPFTGKRCRKLHLINEQFMHRSNLPSGMYECQTYSKKNRSLFKLYDRMFVPDEFYGECYKKHFKTHYNGKPTKRYLKIRQKIEMSERYSQDDRDRIYLT